MAQGDSRTALQDAAKNDAQELLRVIAGLEDGERLLNRVLQRLYAQVNAMELRRLAMAAHVRGGAGIVFAPNKKRLHDELGLTEPALRERAAVQRALDLDDLAFFRAKNEIRGELQRMLELAILAGVQAPDRR